jgi:hypothetical protein
MSFQENLELLSMADDFKIHKTEQGGYIIENKEKSGLMASIESGFLNVTYYVTGCYNSGVDYMPIDIKQLEELREFVRLLQGKGKQNEAF